jgi:hypothetical protein
LSVDAFQQAVPRAHALDRKAFGETKLVELKLRRGGVARNLPRIVFAAEEAGILSAEAVAVVQISR